ncbi:hypothetical protein EVAR_103699_1 [Eumeta japonica]|uniref:Uncharacterized protein n=1 Tax=Eumeta variegata TaxID=151549 RepID=A0A4C1ZWC6_EUMVA|nr:hypothetical protein EVAR_103699_1 [Eumeta japonica]
MGKNKYFRCKYLLESVYKFLEQLSSLRKQERIGPCDHCKRNACNTECPKCRYLIENFCALKKETWEEYNAEKLNMWLQKFRHLHQQMREVDIEILFPSPVKPVSFGSSVNELNNKKDRRRKTCLDKKKDDKQNKVKKRCKKNQGRTNKSRGDKNSNEDQKNQKELEGKKSIGDNEDLDKLNTEEKKKGDKKIRKGNRDKKMPFAQSYTNETAFLKCRPASEMILGNRIVPYEPKNRVRILTKRPLYFKTLYKANKKSGTPAFLNYALSNVEFIEKRVTVLPKQSIMQKYRTVWSKPEYDWFKINTEKMPLYYETGQLLAKADESSGACWFYRNGNIALIYYNDKENNVIERYEVFSTGKDERGRDRPVAVLAVVDFSANCVVYDHHGNVRSSTALLGVGEFNSHTDRRSVTGGLRGSARRVTSARGARRAGEGVRALGAPRAALTTPDFMTFGR